MCEEAWTAHDGRKIRPKSGERPRRTGIWRTLGALLVTSSVALWTGGCGNLTAGGATGDASVAVSGDASDGGGRSSVSASKLTTVSGSDGALRLDGPLGVGGPVEGQVSATLRVFLEDADGNRVPLIGEDARAEVDIQGRTEVELGSSALDVGLYPRIRIVFTDIEADVRSGLEIAGQVLQGRIGVGGEELDSLVVEIDQAVEIAEDEEVELLIDLNSTAWLNAANPALKTVAANVFRNQVSVRVR